MRQAIDMYLEAVRERGRATSTVENYEHRLWRLLGLPGNENRPIRWIVGRGEELYRASIRTGAGDTHINGLNVGRMWARWLMKKKVLKANPFADVEAVGQKRKGSEKERLTVDQSRELEAYCLASPSDPARVLTYGYLMLGKRASEICHVDKRDLDDNGWRLRIRKAKTEASEKSLPLSPELRAMFLGLAEGLGPNDALFTDSFGDRMSRFAARDRVLAVCKAAGVPELPPQALRRTFTDNSALQGYSLRAIAEMDGHTTPAVTERSYLSPNVAAAAQVERNFRVLAGGRR